MGGTILPGHRENARVLVAPTDVSVPNGIGVDSLVGPVVKLPAQHAVTLSSNLY